MTFDRVYSRLIALSLAALSLAASPAEKREGAGEPTLIGATEAVYSITQVGELVGSEAVRQEVLDDNTVVFRSSIKMEPPRGMGWEETTELVMDEESYFPRSYRMDKKMSGMGRTIDQSIDVEMLANVAVVATRLNEVEQKRNIVLRAGTSFYEMGVMHLVHQMIFWYDRDIEGRQSFSALDVARGVVNDFVLHVSGQDTIEFNGETLDVSVFSLEGTAVATRYFVDARGRILRAESGYAVYELTEWSEPVAREG